MRKPILDRFTREEPYFNTFSFPRDDVQQVKDTVNGTDTQFYKKYDSTYSEISFIYRYDDRTKCCVIYKSASQKKLLFKIEDRQA